MTVFSLAWDRGRAEVQALGGMLGPAVFVLPDGREVQPMAVAPWADDTGPAHDALPGILKRLRGEWPCVPFGAPEALAGLPAAWRGAEVPGAGSDFHGYSAHRAWRLVRDWPRGVEIAIDYPEGHSVRRLVRRIEGVTGAARVDVSLSVEVRRDCALPIALHPVFRLPETGAALDPGAFGFGRTYPVAVEPGVSRLDCDAVFDRIDRVPASGGPVNLSRLPLPFDTEEIVQLCGADAGAVSLTDAGQTYRVCLRYDAAVFPSVLLWVSNRGRQAYPWNGRHLALGVEPVCGAFDLGPEIGCAPDNPIARAGVATARRFRAAETFTTAYSIAVEPL